MGQKGADAPNSRGSADRAFPELSRFPSSLVADSPVSVGYSEKISFDKTSPAALRPPISTVFAKGFPRFVAEFRDLTA